MRTTIRYSDCTYTVKSCSQFLNHAGYYNLLFMLFHSLYQWTPLHIAVREGQEVIVEVLVANGADLTIRDKCGVSVTINSNADLFQFKTHKIEPCFVSHVHDYLGLSLLKSF